MGRDWEKGGRGCGEGWVRGERDEEGGGGGVGGEGKGRWGGRMRVGDVREGGVWETKRG